MLAMLITRFVRAFLCRATCTLCVRSCTRAMLTVFVRAFLCKGHAYQMCACILVQGSCLPDLCVHSCLQGNNRIKAPNPSLVNVIASECVRCMRTRARPASAVPGLKRCKRDGSLACAVLRNGRGCACEAVQRRPTVAAYHQFGRPEGIPS